MTIAPPSRARRLPTELLLDAGSCRLGWPSLHPLRSCTPKTRSQRSELQLPRKRDENPSNKKHDLSSYHATSAVWGKRLESTVWRPTFFQRCERSIFGSVSSADRKKKMTLWLTCLCYDFAENRRADLSKSEIEFVAIKQRAYGHSFCRIN